MENVKSSEPINVGKIGLFSSLLWNYPCISFEFTLLD